jgi:hypothetical protein
MNTGNRERWQVATNFVISGTNATKAKSLCWRYDRASEVLEEVQGSLSPDGAMSLLADVAQQTTMWSVVYGMTGGEIAVAMGGDYGDVHHFKLGMK